MVVYFTKQTSNYTQQNIIDILTLVSSKNSLIYNLMLSQKSYILVEGDIHRSQFTADNKFNNYWLKIKGYDDNGRIINELRAAHIYLCFRQFMFDYRSQQYKVSSCYNPPTKGNTDIADISQLMGMWEFVKITYGIEKPIIKRNSKKRSIKKRSNKRLEIINPKTGKPISIKIKRKSKSKSKSKSKK